MFPSLLKKPGEVVSSFVKKIKTKLCLLQKNMKGIFCFFKFLSHKTSRQNHDQVLLANLSKKRIPSIKQLKYITQILNKKEIIAVRICFFVFLISLVGLIINLYFILTKIVPAQGGEYTEGLVGMPKLINPLYASLNDVDQDINSLVYAGLVKINKNQQITAELAANWQVSDDQKEYIFTLKDNLKWHDGQPITAADVFFTIKAIQDPEFKSPIASNFTNVQTEVIDQKTIKFTLKESFSPFLENLTVGILPAHIWQEVVPANALLTDYNLKPIGSGPYKFKSLLKDKLGNIKIYSLEINKNYQPKPAYIKAINFKFYPDFESAAQALKNHNIDGISYLPKELKEMVSTRKDLNFNFLSLPQYTAIFFNQKNNPALKELSLRKALAHALDKQKIIEQALMGEGETIEAPILKGMIGYNPNIEKYEYNPTKAASLLDQAGWVINENKKNNENILENKNDMIRKKGGAELKITLTTVNRAENFKAAQAIQKMWQEIGIKTEIKITEASRIQTDVIRKRDFETFLFGEIFGSDPDPYPFWHSSQTGESGLNLSNFVNKEADRVLEQARQISDPLQRHDKYVHFQNILNLELPAIFLYTPKYLYPVSNKINNNDTQVISIPADRFSNIEEWYIKTKRAFK